jgi:hypothetical protein
MRIPNWSPVRSQCLLEGLGIGAKSFRAEPL